MSQDIAQMDADKAKWESLINRQRVAIEATEEQIRELGRKLEGQRKRLRHLGHELAKTQNFTLNLENP